MSLNIQDLDLSEDAAQALRRVLQVPDVDLQAIRDKRQKMQGATRLDTITPNHDPAVWQIVLKRPERLPDFEQIHNCYTGFELYDAATDSYAQINLYLGIQYLDGRWLESLESNRDFKKLVSLGAVAVNPPAMHVDVATLSEKQIEEAANVAVHYTQNLGEAPFYAALAVYAPHLTGKKREFVFHMLNERRKSRAAAGVYDDASPVATENPALPKGVVYSIGARVLPD